MCGIAGILEPSGPEVIKRMTRALHHRGPDDEGYFADEVVALGMRRLAIIDLARGKQPIASADDRFVIFFNGEIYNYQALRAELLQAGQRFQTESDTEVVLRMYEVHGFEAFQSLRGMFALAIYDKQSKQLILARDFFGIKPLYYWKKGNHVGAFSSEIKSFLTLSEFTPEVNETAVCHYLSFQYNPLAETFFKNVFKLPPAHYMTIDAKTGAAELKRYWRFEFKQDNSVDEEATKQKIFETMKDSVAHHMIADVPVGSFLSGGIDSSIIAFLMQKIRGDKKIKTFTVGFDSPAGELSEGREALETAKPLGTLHHEITVGAEEYFEALPKALWHFDEPVADPSALGLYFLAREAAKHVKVVLSGEGSDELFGGYNIYLEPFARRWISWLPRVMLQALARMPFRGSNYAKRAFSKLEDWYIGNASVFKLAEISKLWKSDMSKTVFDTRLAGLYGRVTDLSDSTKMQYIDINTWLVGDILAKADKMTMAHSLELRVPFLDVEVAKLAATLPNRFKWRGGVTKYLLREAFKKVLPESVRTRRKLGFPTPVSAWLDGNRTEVYETILGNAYIQSHMDTAFIKKLIMEHTARKRDHARKIYLLLMLAIWYNIFIERRPH